MSSVLTLIRHYQNNIEKHPDDEKRVLRCLDKLQQLGVTVAHLQETGVGRTVNSLRKEPGHVGTAARALVAKWKFMVANEEESSGNENEQNASHDDHSDENAVENSYYETQPKNIKTEYSSDHDSDRKCGDYKRKQEKESTNDESLSKRIKFEASNDDKTWQNQYSPVEEKHISDEYDTESGTNVTHSYHQTDEEVIKTNVKPESKHVEKSSRSSSTSSHHKSDKSHHASSGSNDKYKTSSKDIKNVTKDQKNESRGKSESSSHRSKERNTEESHDKGDKYREHKSKDKHKEEKKDSESKDKHTRDKYKEKESKIRSEEKVKSKSHHEHKSGKSDEKLHHRSSEEAKSKDSKSDSKSRSDHRVKEDHKEKKSSDKHKSSHKDRECSRKLDESSHSQNKSNHSSSKSRDNKNEKQPKNEVPKKKSKKESSEVSTNDGVGCDSGTSFAEALGMLSPMKSKKKSEKESKSKEYLSSPTSGLELSPAALLSPNAKLPQLPPLEISALPEISPNYRPRPPPKLLPGIMDEESLSQVMTTKNQRTKVYSGTKKFGVIPSLYELCVRILQENIDALEFTGGVPYEILKPVVDFATPDQLFILEHYNPYLMEDTDHLWKRHCEKSFRNQKREEMETWREMYLRCKDEREAKLRSLTENIKLTQEVRMAPVKQTKMAYVDTIVKPPRNVARKQAVHGTARLPVVSPAARVAALANSNNVLKAPDAPRSVGARSINVPVVSAGSFKPKKAPLMQKALQFMRGKKR